LAIHIASLDSRLLTEHAQVFLEYAITIGDGKIAEKNMKSIAVVVSKLAMVKDEEIVKRYYLQSPQMVEASNFFTGLPALQVIELVATRPSPRPSLVARLEQTQRWKYEIVTRAKLTRNENLEGFRFTEICDLTGLPRTAIFSVGRPS
jgi:hypothetical protein